MRRKACAEYPRRDTANIAQALADSSERLLDHAQAGEWDDVKRLASDHWSLCTQLKLEADSNPSIVSHVRSAAARLETLLAIAAKERMRLGSELTTLRSGAGAMRAYQRAQD